MPCFQRTRKPLIDWTNDDLYFVLENVVLCFDSESVEASWGLANVHLYPTLTTLKLVNILHQNFMPSKRIRVSTVYLLLRKEALSSDLEKNLGTQALYLKETPQKKKSHTHHGDSGEKKIILILSNNFWLIYQLN